MSEDVQIVTGSKAECYASLLPQIRGLVEGETDLVANLANIAAALKEQFGWLWIGFYLVKGDELVVGPFQGPVACTRIRKGRGVCGASWEKAETLIVPDVEAFPGHIACSSRSRSEIVVPLLRQGEAPGPRGATMQAETAGGNGAVVGVLDIDSELLNDFDEEDRRWLEELVKLIPGLGD